MRLIPLLPVALAATTPLSPRQDSLAYQEFTTSADITYRIAIPADASPGFDVAFQIVAPAATGWAGIGWGGGMLNNPLVVAWANGESVVASSRTAV